MSCWYYTVQQERRHVHQHTVQQELGLAGQASSMQLMKEYAPQATLMLLVLVPIMEPVGWTAGPNEDTLLNYHYTAEATTAIIISAVLGAATTSVTCSSRERCMHSSWLRETESVWRKGRERGVVGERGEGKSELFGTDSSEGVGGLKLSDVQPEPISKACCMGNRYEMGVCSGGAADMLENTYLELKGLLDAIAKHLKQKEVWVGLNSTIVLYRLCIWGCLRLHVHVCVRVCVMALGPLTCHLSAAASTASTGLCRTPGEFVDLPGDRRHVIADLQCGGPHQNGHRPDGGLRRLWRCHASQEAGRRGACHDWHRLVGPPAASNPMSRSF